jgi:hypothetical protein
MNNTQSIQFILEYLEYKERLKISQVSKFQRRMVIKYNIIHQDFDNIDDDEHYGCTFDCMNQNLATPIICGWDDCQTICCNNEDQHPYNTSWNICVRCDAPLCGECAFKCCISCGDNDLFFCEYCHYRVVCCDEGCCKAAICDENQSFNDERHSPYVRCDICHEAQFIKHMEMCPICFDRFNDTRMEMHMCGEHGNYMESIKNYVHPLCALEYYMRNNPERNDTSPGDMLCKYKYGQISVEYLVFTHPEYSHILNERGTQLDKRTKTNWSRIQKSKRVRNPT